MAQQKKNMSLEKQVRDAVRKLTDEGKPITNQAVREIIGGGSFRDLGPLVKQIKAELAAKEQAAREAPDMPEDFHDAAAAMWRMAWQCADEIAASERRAHAAEIENLKADADEAISNCGLVEDERDAAETRAQALSVELDGAQAALREAQLEIARLTGQLAEREQHIQKWLATPTAAGASEAETEDASMADDDAQLDMFAPEKADKTQPDDPEPIAAE